MTDAAETPDIGATVTVARDALATLEAAFVRCWRYDLGMLADQARPEAGPVTISAKPSPALWTDDKHTLHDAYRRATQQLARGHYTMADAGAVAHWVTDIHLYPPARARTIPLDLARTVTVMLSTLLARGLAAHDAGDLAPTESHHLLMACDYARAALRELPEAITNPESWAPEAIVEPCLHCTERPPEVGRKWCATCRRGHAPSRMSCRVCGLGDRSAA